jgi:hypothetical protein
MLRKHLRWYWNIGTPSLVLTGLLAGLLLVQPSFFRLRRPVYFHKLADLKHFAQQHGLQVSTNANRPLEHFSQLFISPEPMSRERLSWLLKSDCGLTPAWRNLVWAAYHTGAPEGTYPVYADSIGGHSRIWGRLVVAGDPQLLDRLEALFQE